MRLRLDTHVALWAVDTMALLAPHIVEALRTEPMRLVTGDRKILSYSDTFLAC